MTNSFSNSRHKILRLFLSIIISILVIFFVVDLSLSLILNHHLNKAKINFKDNAGLNFDYKIALFDIFYGILINDLSISKDENRIFDFRSIRLKLDLTNTILNRQLLCEEIYVQDPHVYKVGRFEKRYLSFLLAGAKDSGDILKSTMIQLYNLNFMDLVNLDIGGYIALAQSKIFLMRGKIQIIESEFLGKTDIDQSNSLLDKPLDYAFEATYLDNDFVINKLDLISFSARLIMFGKIKDYGNAVDLEMRGELKNLLLEDIKQLNNDYLYAGGLLEAHFSINGPMDSVDFKTDIKISDCKVKILDVLKINKIDSNLIWDKQGLRSQGISGLIDSSPVNLNLRIDKQDARNKINLELSSQNLDLFDEVKINFQGYFLKKVLEGDIEVALGRTYNQKFLTKYFIFRNLYLNLQDFGFKSDALEIHLGESDMGDTQKSFKKIELTKLSGNLAIVGNNLELYNFQVNVYNGTLTGNAIFGSKENTLFYNSKINLENLETLDMFKELLSSEYQLSGLLSGTIDINSKLGENITGDVQIINGKIENNAILVAISDFFGIPSLRTVDFSNLKIIFHKIWNQYETQISLFSTDVGIYLDNKSFADGTVDGYLLAKLTTELMDESPRFRRLFKYIGYKEPTVYFPFKLKGHTGKPRIEWLKNEFKEKIQDFLSEANKKLLQEELNKLIEEFAQ